MDNNYIPQEVMEKDAYLIFADEPLEPQNQANENNISIAPTDPLQLRERLEQVGLMVKAIADEADEADEDYVDKLFNNDSSSDNEEPPLQQETCKEDDNSLEEDDDDDLFNDDSTSNVEEPLPQEAQNQVIEDDDDLFNDDASNIAETSLSQENINENSQTVEQVPEKIENTISSLLALDYKNINRTNLEITKTNMIIQANAFIESCIVTPTTDARILFYLALAEVREDDNFFRPIHIHALDLVRAGIFKEKYMNKVYPRANKACEDLSNSKVFVKVANDKWVKIPLMGRVEYDKGHMCFVLESELKKFFLHIKSHFTKTICNILFQLPNQDVMTVFNSLFMKYNIEEYYGHLDENGVARITFSREEIENVFEGEYKANKNKKNAKKRYANFYDLVSHLLKKAIKEINNTGLLYIDMEKPKKNSNHEISYFTFKVSKTQTYQLQEAERDKQIHERQEEKEFDLVSVYLYKRFGIYSTNEKSKEKCPDEEKHTLENLRKKGVSLVQLKLASIVMQANLNAYFDCIWEQKAYENGKDAKYAIRTPYSALVGIINKNQYAKWLIKYDKITDYDRLKSKGIHINPPDYYTVSDKNLNLVEEYYKNEDIATAIDDIFKEVLETVDTVPNDFWNEVEQKRTRKEAL